MNKIIVHGNVGQDPEVRKTQNGKTVANFSLATNRYTGKNAAGEKLTKTDWHKVVCWGPQAEAIERLVSKGAKLLVTGIMTYSQYENKEGQSVKTAEILCTEFEITKYSDSNEPKSSKKLNDNPVDENEGDHFDSGDDDLPF